MRAPLGSRCCTYACAAHLGKREEVVTASDAGQVPRGAGEVVGSDCAAPGGDVLLVRLRLPDSTAGAAVGRTGAPVDVMRMTDCVKEAQKPPPPPPSHSHTTPAPLPSHLPGHSEARGIDRTACPAGAISATGQAAVMSAKKPLKAPAVAKISIFKKTAALQLPYCAPALLHLSHIIRVRV